MACMINHWKGWIDAPRRIRALGISLILLATLILFSGVYFTTGARQIRSAAVTQYEYSKAVSDAVRTYTQSCEILAASSNVQALSELDSNSAKNALPLVNQVIQDIWNVNSILPDTSTIAVLFPEIQLAATKNQYRFTEDFSRLLSATYSGLSYEQILSQDVGSWHSYYAVDMCYAVRSLQGNGHKVYILVNFPVKSVLSAEERNITAVGDASGCLYVSRDNLPEDFYSNLLSALEKDRKIRIGGRSYYVICNVFPNLSMRFFTLIPMLTSRFLTIRITSCALFLAMIVAAELLLLSFKKRSAEAKKEMEATPQGEQKTDPVIQYTLSGLTRTLLDLPDGRGLRISQQCYKLLKMSASDDCAVIGFTLLLDQERLLDGEVSDKKKHRPITPYFILSNMLQDLLYDRHVGELCYGDDKFIALSNLLPGESEADLQAIIEQVISSARDYLHLTFVASEPAISRGCEHLHATLLQTNHQLDHARLWWQTEGVPEDCGQEQNGLDFYKRLVLLTSCISENNFVKAEEEFNRILQSCIPKSVEQVKEAERRLGIVLDTLISLTGYPSSLLPNHALPPKTIATCQEAGAEIFRVQLAAQRNAGAKPGEERINAITKHVAENYSDPELGVGAIAAHLGMNTAYISRAFKIGTGTNLLEYIHRTRIAAAKELLQHYSIKEVSTMVGFVDLQSFSRTFRKYESVTPAEYKRNCTPSNSSLPE